MFSGWKNRGQAKRPIIIGTLRCLVVPVWWQMKKNYQDKSIVFVACETLAWLHNGGCWSFHGLVKQLFGQEKDWPLFGLLNRKTFNFLQHWNFRVWLTTLTQVLLLIVNREILQTQFLLTQVVVPVFKFLHWTTGIFRVDWDENLKPNQN